MIDVTAVPPVVVPGVRPLVDQEIDGTNQFTHYMEIKSGDIPAGLVVSTAWTFHFTTFPKYMRMNNVALIVQQGFEDTGAPTFDSVMVDVGDAGDPDGYITQAQVAAKAGALIKVAWKTGAYVVPKDYAANTVAECTLTPKTAFSLSNLRKGSLIVLFNLFKFPPPIDTDSV